MSTSWEEMKKIRPVNEELLAEQRQLLYARIYGYKLMELRKKQGLTQAQLGERIGVSQKAVSKIERGDIENAKVVTIKKYVEAVGGELSVEAIIGNERNRLI